MGSGPWCNALSHYIFKNTTRILFSLILGHHVEFTVSQCLQYHSFISSFACMLISTLYRLLRSVVRRLPVIRLHLGIRLKFNHSPRWPKPRTDLSLLSHSFTTYCLYCQFQQALIKWWFISFSHCFVHKWFLYVPGGQEPYFMCHSALHSTWCNTAPTELTWHLWQYHSPWSLLISPRLTAHSEGQRCTSIFFNFGYK